MASSAPPPEPEPATLRKPRARFIAVGLLTLALGAGGGWRLARTLSPAPSPAPNAVDIGFAQFMSLHHQQAVGMAQMVLAGEPGPLDALARSIAYSQLLELGEMKGWLRIWGQSTTPVERSMNWMRAGHTPPDDTLQRYLLDCENSPTGMPGLATLTELDSLRRLQGRERDHRFLTLMQAHHLGGIPMARFAAENAATARVRELARWIVNEQTMELERIRRTLAAMELSEAD